MLRFIAVIVSMIIFLASCKCNSQKTEGDITTIKYNIIEPGNGIYAIAKKDVDKDQTKNKYYEAVHKRGNKITKIERFNDKGKLTDNLSVAAVTEFDYDFKGRVNFIKYYDKNGNNAEEENFGYWSVEYIYDEQNRVRMEIYRDSESKFLTVPVDNSGSIAKINFLSPVLTYEYIGDKLKIKALDQNFNLLKEVFGEKPCVPFIDCGEYD